MQLRLAGCRNERRLAVEPGTHRPHLTEERPALVIGLRDVAQAREVAQGRDIWVAGGASVINQYLAAGLVKRIDISIAPVILCSGARLFDGLRRSALKLKQIRAVDAPGVVHINYEVN